MAYIESLVTRFTSTAGWNTAITGSPLAHGPGPRRLLELSRRRYKVMVDLILEGPWRNLLVALAALIPGLSPIDEATPGWSVFVRYAQSNLNQFLLCDITPDELQLNLLFAAEAARRNAAGEAAPLA